jgi:hypothetical protein
MSNVALKSTPEELVYARAAHLLAVRNAWSDTFGGRRVETADPGALEDAVRTVRRIVRSIDGAYASIIGGLAVQDLGYERWTDDADVIVDAAHYGEVLERLRQEGFLITSDFSLKHKLTGAKLDLLKEGSTLKDSRFPLPHPSELGPNADFAALHGIIRLKLDSGGRFKDLADIVELLKRDISKSDAVRKNLPPAFHEKYDELVAQAHRELK